MLNWNLNRNPPGIRIMLLNSGLENNFMKQNNANLTSFNFCRPNVNDTSLPILCSSHSIWILLMALRKLCIDTRTGKIEIISIDIIRFGFKLFPKYAINIFEMNFQPIAHCSNMLSESLIYWNFYIALVDFPSITLQILFQKCIYLTPSGRAVFIFVVG